MRSGPRPPLLALALTALWLGAGCQHSNPSESPMLAPVPTQATPAERQLRPAQGYYDVTVEAVTDTCTPPLVPTGSFRRLMVPIHDMRANLPVISGPQGNAAVRMDMDLSRPLHYESRAPGACATARVTRDARATVQSESAFEVLWDESFTGSDTCASADAGVNPGWSPAHDCRTQRRMHFTLAEACRVPCRFQPIRAVNGETYGCQCPGQGDASAP